MSDINEFNLQLDQDFTYQSYSQPVQPLIQPVVEGGTTVVTTINGSSGPNINLGSSIGFGFTGGAGGNVSLVVTDAALVRSSIGAAKSGANDNITSFTNLTGNSGVNPWTGTPNGSSQSTYPATVAAAGYDQTQIQALMDKMQDVTEFMMFLVAALLAPGVVET